MARDIELVCFDLGRVLVRICNDWLHACTVAGVRAPAAAPDLAAKARLHELVCRVEVGDFDHDAFCREAGPALGLSPKDVSSIWDAYPRGPYPGAIDLLDDLKAAGVRTACLSNTNHNHWRLLRDSASHTYFPFDRLNYAFASHLLRLRKPDAAIYAHVERAAGVQGKAVVFFDDLPENVAAAAARGWNAYRVDPASDNPVPQIRKWLADQGVLR